MHARRAWIAALVASLAICASPALAGRPAAARQYLDRRTAATITVVGQPLVFARERTAAAVNARDYVSLSAIDVNRGGQHALYWWGYVWSTIDRGAGESGNAAAAGWLLLADGRPIALQPLAQDPAELGVAELPLPRPVRGARPVLFIADAEALEYIGSARELRLQNPDGTSVYTLWRDARAELRTFLARLSK